MVLCKKMIVPLHDDLYLKILHITNYVVIRVIQLIKL